MNNVLVENFAFQLHNLFELKKFGESLSDYDLELIGRFEHSKLIKALVDPSVPFALPANFVPSKLELELAYSVVTSRTPAKGVAIGEMVRFVDLALKCAADLQLMLRGESA